MENYTKIKVLGKGSFGSAILIKRRTDGQEFVIKEVSLQRMSVKEKEEARNECRILQNLRHPNIVRYIEHFESRGNLYIVMEYADGGDLHSLVVNRAKGVNKGVGGGGKGPLTEKEIMYYFSQICLAMEYLHSRHILHRDIKTMNIFLMKNGSVKLGDFGISTILRSTMGLAKTVCGTPYYFSPELCQNKPYNNRSDIWALGVLLYECATAGKHPFEGANMQQLMRRIVRESYPPLSSSRFSSEFRQLIDVLLQKDPKKRPNIKQVFAQPIVRRSLERLEEDLMLATQCRVRLNDIIDFDDSNENKGKKDAGGGPIALDNKAKLAVDTPSALNGRSPSATPEQRLNPLLRNVNMLGAKPFGGGGGAPLDHLPNGLSPGALAAMQVAQQQQQQQQQQHDQGPQHAKPPPPPSPSADPQSRRPSNAARLSPDALTPAKNPFLYPFLGPKPALPDRFINAGNNNININNNNLRPKPQAPLAADRPFSRDNAQGNGRPVQKSPLTGPADDGNVWKYDIPSPPAGPHHNNNHPQQPQQQPPPQPALTPENRASPQRRPSNDPGLQRIDAILQRYESRATPHAKETIHAYMKRKQQEQAAQREDAQRRQRVREELRDKEMKAVLAKQQAAVKDRPEKQAARRPVTGPSQRSPSKGANEDRLRYEPQLFGVGASPTKAGQTPRRNASPLHPPPAMQQLIPKQVAPNGAATGSPHDVGDARGRRSSEAAAGGAYAKRGERNLQQLIEDMRRNVPVSPRHPGGGKVPSPLHPSNGIRPASPQREEEPKKDRAARPSVVQPSKQAAAAAAAAAAARSPIPSPKKRDNVKRPSLQRPVVDSGNGVRSPTKEARRRSDARAKPDAINNNNGNIVRGNADDDVARVRDLDKFQAGAEKTPLPLAPFNHPAPKTEAQRVDGKDRKDTPVERVSLFSDAKSKQNDLQFPWNRRARQPDPLQHTPKELVPADALRKGPTEQKTAQTPPVISRRQSRDDVPAGVDARKQYLHRYPYLMPVFGDLPKINSNAPAAGAGARGTAASSATEFPSAPQLADDMKKNNGAVPDDRSGAVGSKPQAKRSRFTLNPMGTSGTGSNNGSNENSKIGLRASHAAGSNARDAQPQSGPGTPLDGNYLAITPFKAANANKNVQHAHSPRTNLHSAAPPSSNKPYWARQMEAAKADNEVENKKSRTDDLSFLRPVVREIALRMQKAGTPVSSPRQSPSPPTAHVSPLSRWSAASPNGAPRAGSESTPTPVQILRQRLESLERHEEEKLGALRVEAKAASADDDASRAAKPTATTPRSFREDAVQQKRALVNRGASKQKPGAPTDSKDGPVKVAKNGPGKLVKRRASTGTQNRQVSIGVRRPKRIVKRKSSNARKGKGAKQQQKKTKNHKNGSGETGAEEEEEEVAETESGKRDSQRSNSSGDDDDGDDGENESSDNSDSGEGSETELSDDEPVLLDPLDLPIITHSDAVSHIVPQAHGTGSHSDRSGSCNGSISNPGCGSSHYGRQSNASASHGSSPLPLPHMQVGTDDIQRKHAYAGSQNRNGRNGTTSPVSFSLIDPSTGEPALGLGSKNVNYDYRMHVPQHLRKGDVGADQRVYASMARERPTREDEEKFRLLMRDSNNATASGLPAGEASHAGSVKAPVHPLVSKEVDGRVGDRSSQARPESAGVEKVSLKATGNGAPNALILSKKRLSAPAVVETLRSMQENSTIEEGSQEGDPEDRSAIPIRSEDEEDDDDFEDDDDDVFDKLAQASPTAPEKVNASYVFVTRPDRGRSALLRHEILADQDALIHLFKRTSAAFASGELPSPTRRQSLQREDCEGDVSLLSPTAFKTDFHGRSASAEGGVSTNMSTSANIANAASAYEDMLAHLGALLARKERERNADRASQLAGQAKGNPAPTSQSAPHSGAVDISSIAYHLSPLTLSNAAHTPERNSLSVLDLLTPDALKETRVPAGRRHTGETTPGSNAGQSSKGDTSLEAATPERKPSKVQPVNPASSEKKDEQDGGDYMEGDTSTEMTLYENDYVNEGREFLSDDDQNLRRISSDRAELFAGDNNEDYKYGDVETEEECLYSMSDVGGALHDDDDENDPRDGDDFADAAPLLPTDFGVGKQRNLV